MNKYEQLIEHIINDNEQAARELFHQIVVEKSRDIYESLMDEDEQVEENFGGNETQGFIDDVTQDVQHDEQGIGEDDEEGEEFELGGEEHGDEFGSEEGEEGEGDVEDRVQDLEDELDSLKAEFDKLLAGEEAEEHDHPGIHDVGGDDVGSEEGEDEMFEAEGSGSGKSGSGKSGSGVMEGENPFAKGSGSGKSGSGKSGSGKSGSGKSGSGVKESRSQSDLMREYVEKVKEFYKGDNTEGSTVGTGGDEPSLNKNSSVASKNDMGGTTANIGKGGSEQAPDGTSPKKANNYGTKGQGQLIGKVQNTPGSDAGKSSFKTKEAGHGAEKKGAGEGKLAGADGSVAINSKSEIGGKVR